MIEIKLHEYNEYFQRKIHHINQYQLQSLNDYFDKYTALYSLYSRMYFTILPILKANNIISGNVFKVAGKTNNPIYNRREPDEKLISTLYVSKYLDTESNVIIEQCREEINSFINFIEKDIFHIVLYFGVHQAEEDKRLLKQLQSSSTANKLKALLMILYCLKRNIFTGEKGFYQNQQDILSPAITSLEKVINMFHEKLMQEQQILNI